MIPPQVSPASPAKSASLIAEGRERGNTLVRREEARERRVAGGVCHLRRPAASAPRPWPRTGSGLGRVRPSSTSSGPGHRDLGAGGRRARVDLDGGLDEQRSGDHVRLEAAAEAFPEIGGLQQELAVRGRRVERGGVALGGEAVGAQQRLELAEAVGAAEAEGRDVAARPEAGAVRDDEDRPGRRGPARARSRRGGRPGGRRSRGRGSTISRSTLAASIGQRVSSTITQRLGSPVGQGMTPCGPGMSARTRAASLRKGRSMGTAKP